MGDIYVVAVESNLVAAIERAPRDPANPPPGSTLEIGTALAQRYRESGCIDGSYPFEDASGARTFAALCLAFTKALAERRLAAIEALPVAFESYHPDDRPRGGQDG